MKEIERKWLLDSELAKEIISNSRLKVSEISQYFLDKNTRIRLESHNFEEEPILTIRRGKGKIRHEVAINLTHRDANKLIKLAKCSLVKERFYVNVGPYEFLIDKLNDDLFLCKVNFENDEKADSFEPSRYLNSELFIKEVTDEEEYSSYDLAKRQVHVIEEITEYERYCREQEEESNEQFSL